MDYNDFSKVGCPTRLDTVVNEQSRHDGNWIIIINVSQVWWVTHACNSSIGKPLCEGGPTWIAQWGLGKPGLRNETLIQRSQK